jgi:hypothetical protein
MVRRSALSVLPLVVGALLLPTGAFMSAWATTYPSPTHRFIGGKLDICDQGSFFVGGALKTTKYLSGSTPSTFYSAIVVGQMYVSFQIPKQSTGYPIIMISGGAHTGASLESTPDGGEGWAPYALRHGYPVFLVDQAGRGRSSFDSSAIHEGKARLQAGDSSGSALIPNFLTLGPNSDWTNWFGHLVLPGTTTPTGDITAGLLEPHGWDPNDPSPLTVHGVGVFPQFPIHTSTPYLRPDQTPNSSLTLNFTNSGTWGPPPLGPTEFYNLDYYRETVPNSEQTLPTATCSTCTPQNLTGSFASSQVWTPTDMAELVENLGKNYGGAIVVTHSQSGPIGPHLVRMLREQNALQYLKGLVTVEGTSCSMPAAGITAADFDHVPWLVVKGDYSTPNQTCTDTTNAIIARRLAGQGTAAAEYLQLDQAPSADLAWPAPLNRPIMLGITHMMMDGSNQGPEPCAQGLSPSDCLGHSNLDVMDVILNWGQAHFDQAKKQNCPQG